MSQLVFVLNGPNLNLLGTRETHIYGRETLLDIEKDCRDEAAHLDLVLEFHQSNAEHELIGWIHQARERKAAVVINAGAYTHTSVALHDALKACDAPIIEVHISNVHRREEFRHHSYVSMAATGVIVGCGTQGYLFALQRIATLARQGSR